MPLLPPRRWFQFKLSTWFVLVAIVAWTMMLWRYAEVVRLYERPDPPKLASDVQKYLEEERRRAQLRRDSIGGKVLGTYTFGGKTFDKIEVQRNGPNFRLIYPALALAAFIGWKAVRAIGKRIRAENARYDAEFPGDNL